MLVKKSDALEIDLLIQEWAAAEFSDAKLAELKARHPEVDWLNLADRVLRESRQLQPRFRTPVAQIWQQIDEEIAVANPQPKSIPFARRQVVYLVAASVALLAVLFIALRPGSDGAPNTYATTAGRTQTINLPDGSTLHLAAASTVKFDAENFSAERTIELEGEAFFEVQPGRRFRVETARGTVTVLGTSFNVRQRGPNFTVACKTGKVEVRAGSATAVLSPGEQADLDPEGELRQQTTNPDRIGAWQDGTFYFDGQALEFVFAEVERQFTYQVEATPEILRLPCNGFFTRDNLNSAMEEICKPLQLTFVVDADKKTVRISR